MPETPKKKTLLTSSATLFVPRQVMMLESHSNSITTKDKKKNKDKKKKSSKSSETIANKSCLVTSETVTSGKDLLISSIATFLESNGFAKTLSVFKSEAHLQNFGLVTSSVNLEDLMCKYLEASKGHADATISWVKEKDLENGTISRNDEGENAHDVSEDIHKKKRKHKNGAEVGAKDEAAENRLENGLIKYSKARSKDNEMNKEVPDSGASESPEVSGEKNNKNMEKSNGLGDMNDPEKLKFAEGLHGKTKDKKRKKKSASNSVEENGENNHLKESSGIAAKNDHDISMPKTDVHDKVKKRKKHQKSSIATDENTDAGKNSISRKFVEEKIEQLESLINNSALPAESNVKSKGEKKKKTKESVALSEENIDEKKAHKKRKRSDSEERAAQVENGTIMKEFKHEGGEAVTTGKKRKTEEEKLTTQDKQKVLGGLKEAEGNLQQEKEGASSKSMKKEKGSAASAEPKTVKAFQRVKVDEVKFVDQRLQDNSYWALDESGSGYGAKAQEVLGQVRGRDFRHEKTKKKRGSYRGGQIDLQSHSIKFNDSDEE